MFGTRWTDVKREKILKALTELSKRFKMNPKFVIIRLSEKLPIISSSAANSNPWVVVLFKHPELRDLVANVKALWNPGLNQVRPLTMQKDQNINDGAKGNHI